MKIAFRLVQHGFRDGALDGPRSRSLTGLRQSSLSGASNEGADDRYGYFIVGQKSKLCEVDLRVRVAPICAGAARSLRHTSRGAATGSGNGRPTSAPEKANAPAIGAAPGASSACPRSFPEGTGTLGTTAEALRSGPRGSKAAWYA